MFKRSTLVLVALLAVSTALHAQQDPSAAAYNTTLFDTFTPESSGGRSSALWGYTAPDGREYALLGGYDGTYIVDITERPIRLVTMIPGPHSGWRELKTYSHYAYVVSEGGGGLQIIDLSALPDNAYLTVADTSQFRTGHTVSQEGHYLYINGTKAEAAANGGTIVFDLLPSPTAPRRLGAYTEHYVHDAIIYNDTMYASAINNGQLDIVALSASRDSSKLIASIRYPGAGTHNADLTPDHRYVMTTDEISTTPKTLKFWDIADRDNITKVADYTPVPGEIVHNVHTKGNIAFVAWYTAGTRIIDISNPMEPAQIGFYDTYEGASANYSGNWEVYPYFPSGKIIASDMQSGLFVFTFDGAVRGRVSGVVKDAATGAVLPGARIVLPALGRTIIADSAGAYSIAGAADTLEFTATTTDYFPRTGSLALLAANGSEPGGVQDILLQAQPLANIEIRAIDSVTGLAIPNVSFTVNERTIDERLAPNPIAITLPKDSVYHINIGAWGYRQLKLILTNRENRVYTVRLSRGYMDNVETNLGWSIGDIEDDASGGVWERGFPEGTYSIGRTIQPPEQHTVDGRIAFFTGLANSNEQGVGTNDVDGGATYLTSPLMRLADSTDPYINFALWYSRDGNPDAVDDTLELQISGDNGTTWMPVAQIFTSPMAWVEQHYRVRDIMPPTNSMRFRVRASDLNSPSLVESGLDDFSVTNGGPGDLGQDSIVFDGSASVNPGVRLLEGLYASAAPTPMRDHGVLSIQTASPLRGATIDIFASDGSFVAEVYSGSIDHELHLALDFTQLVSGIYHWRLRADDGRATGGAIVVVR